MKNRRTSLAALLLLSCVTLGVGYAAVSQTLEFSGTIGANTTTQFNVEFTNYTIEEQTSTTVTSEKLAQSGPRSAELNFTGFTNVGDKIVTYLEVTNKTVASAGLSARLGALSGTGAETDYFRYSYAWGEDNKDLLASGESTYIEISVELIKARIDETQAAGTSFIVTFVATAEHNA